MNIERSPICPTWIQTQNSIQKPATSIVANVDVQNWDGKVKRSSSRRREFRWMRRTYVRRSEHEMKRNAEIGLFTKPLKIVEKM